MLTLTGKGIVAVMPTTSCSKMSIQPSGLVLVGRLAAMLITSQVCMRSSSSASAGGYPHTLAVTTWTTTGLISAAVHCNAEQVNSMSCPSIGLI